MLAADKSAGPEVVAPGDDMGAGQERGAAGPRTHQAGKKR